MNAAFRATVIGLLLVPTAVAQQKEADRIDVVAIGRHVAERFDPAGPALLPFAAMREAGDRIEVQLPGDDLWYAWEKIDAARAADVIAVCREAFAVRWWKRVTEDLVIVLDLMGHATGPTVDLELVELESGKRVVRRGIAMTHGNRQRVKAAFDGRDTRRDVLRPLDPGVIEADLEHLHALIESRFAYAAMKGLTPSDAVDGLRRTLGPKSSGRDFALAVQRCIARFGDGHAGVDPLQEYLPRQWLPFLVEQIDGRFVAVRPNRSGFADDDHPFLERLDGHPVAHWLEAAKQIVPAGSAQLVERRAVRFLREWLACRHLAGEPWARGRVDVVLSGGDGERVERTLDLTTRRPTNGTWPRTTQHALLADAKVGYLRIASMDDDSAFLDGIDAAMERFRDTRGLIVDVRGNGGGTRHVLRRFLPYLMSPREPAVVVNVAAARLAPGEAERQREGHLADRFLFPTAWPDWSAAAREFEPAWDLPKRGFSGWHWMVVEREGNPAAFHYDRPVVVLMDRDGFSATDVFLGAMKDRRGITLLGTPSGGGSARSRVHELPRTGLRVRLASMASFRPDGTPYDGVGIAPDVVVEPAASDLIGTTDRQLDRALELLKR